MLFKKQARDLLQWARQEVKPALSLDDINQVKDVGTAEVHLKKLDDIGHEIASKASEFDELATLGASMLKQNKDKDVESILQELSLEQEAAHRAWQEKENWLKQTKDLLIFTQEAVSYLWL